MNHGLFRRSGHVLVMTVMLLAVVALIVASISRHSLLLATTAKSNKDALLKKWAVASTQKFWLKRGEQLLATNRQNRIVFNVRLSGFNLVNEIRDESSKLDVNVIHDQLSQQELASLVRQLSGSSQLVVRPRPLSVSVNDATRRPFESWGQIFEGKRKDSYLEIRKAANRLSCWGGKLNIHSANRDIVQQTVKSLAGNIVADRLTEAISQQPQLSLGQLLAQIDANERQARSLRQVLSDRSSSTSIWTDIIEESKRTSCFAVEQRPVENISRYQTFTWQ